LKTSLDPGVPLTAEEKIEINQMMKERGKLKKEEDEKEEEEEDDIDDEEDEEEEKREKKEKKKEDIGEGDEWIF
jgi:hypothetical protein